MHIYDDFISQKIVVTKTLRWRLRTTGAKEVLRREPVRTFALSFASLHLRSTHLRSYLNLINSAASIYEVQFVPSFCSACLPPSNLEWQTRALAGGRSSLRGLVWILRTGSP